MLAITFKKKIEKKGSKWGTPKKYLKKYISILKLNSYVKSGQPFHNKKEDLGTVACAVILATGTVDIGCLRW